MSELQPAGSAHVGTESSLSPSLLERLQDHSEMAWQRLDYLYRQVVCGWCRAAGLSAADAEDVTQWVFQAVASHIGQFRRQPGWSFRAWLWTITQNKLRDHFRRASRQAAVPGGTTFQEMLGNVPDSCSALETTSPPPPSQEERQELLRRALELLQSEFEPRTWQAFWKLVIEDKTAADVAAELGMSKGAVYVAKSRVLKRLREEFADLLE
ncbi:ECF RNA polymerase sigma factor SigD [bacterium HR36]|uniref:RNA polymerase sigma factor Y n=1 Tax=uncultured Planctomycetota bacterium TaxID=120965 RepID=H5SIK4_9BACT|nr:RNA polymerase sigma factor Y [uncultured Planctomycetota bacterium]GBD35995.1 ECF RNA polymerase sigma factor SigD [bacterium HR36]